jgi:hypothetical protein
MKRWQATCFLCTLLAIFVAILVVLTITFNNKSCLENFDKWTISKSTIPSTSGYSYTISSDTQNIQNISFERNNVLEFTIGSVNTPFPMVSFRKSSIVSVFLPKWSFNHTGIDGEIAYNVLGFMNKYVMSYGNMTWKTKQILSSSIPLDIDITNSNNYIIAIFNEKVAVPLSYMVCMKNDMNSFENVLTVAMVVSFDIGK